MYHIACDYGNSSSGLWAPILAILSNGEDFEFFGYDSSTRSFALSGSIKGLENFQSSVEFLRSVKKGTSTSILLLSSLTNDYSGRIHV